MADKKFFVSEEVLRQAYEELGSTSKVAACYGVSKKLILTYMKRYGIERNQRNVPELILRITELAGKGKTSIEISKELGYSHGQVNVYIRRNKICVKRYHKGFRTTDSGYILIYDPKHPNARASGYVREQHKVMAEALGRPIAKGEVVHHIDENKSNNELSNLQLMTAFDHKSYHSRKPRKKKSSIGAMMI